MDETSKCSGCDKCDPTLRSHGTCGCPYCNQWRITYVLNTEGETVMLVEMR